MARIQVLAATIVFTMLMLAACQDMQVTCVFSQDCLLPCSFRPSGEEVILWKRQEANIHSFYFSSSQPESQDGRYAGRTSLFHDLIAQGNASLLLQRTELSDKGLYSCYTSTTLGTSEVSISLKVIAPVQSVSIETTDDGVACVSRGAYPLPYVSWSTDPPTEPGTLQAWTRATTDSQGLFFVESTVKTLANLPEHAYICSIFTASGEWTASLRRQGNVLGEAGQALVIPCPVQNSSLWNSILSWTFNGYGNASLILQKDPGKAEPDIQPRWERWVRGVSGDGSLLLQNPEGPELTGTYTCMFSAPQSQHLVQTKITIGGAESGKTSMIVTVAIVAIIAVIIAIAVLAWKTGPLQGCQQCSEADNSSGTQRQGHGAGGGRAAGGEGEPEDEREDMLESSDAV